MPTTISITAIASISALGNNQVTIWNNYQSNQHCFVATAFGTQKALTAPLDYVSKQEVDVLKKSDSKYKSLDNSVIFAIAASRKAIEKAGWKRAIVLELTLVHLGVQLNYLKNTILILLQMEK